MSNNLNDSIKLMKHNTLSRGYIAVISIIAKCWIIRLPRNGLSETEKG